jgi:hypothetical protein
MARAGSCSRGRQVSFKIDRGSDRDVYDRVDESPSNRGKERNNSDRKSYSRAQTPGPENDLPKGAIQKRGRPSKRRLKGGGDQDVAA